MAKDSAVRIEIGRSFHQLGTVQENVCESDLVLLWDGTTRRCSLAERKLLEVEYVCISEFRYIGAAPVVNCFINKNIINNVINVSLITFIRIYFYRILSSNLTVLKH